MIDTNKDLKNGRCNGTLCRGVGLQLKTGVNVKTKEWDGKIIPTVSVNDVDYMVCQHYADSITPLAKFKLYPNKD